MDEAPSTNAVREENTEAWRRKWPGQSPSIFAYRGGSQIPSLEPTELLRRRPPLYRRLLGKLVLLYILGRVIRGG